MARSRSDAILPSMVRTPGLQRPSLTRFAAPLALAALSCGAALSTGCKRSNAATIPTSAPVTSAATASGAWYDAAPLLGSLRPAARVDLAKAAGVARLEDLPLYDLTLVLDVDKGTFVLGEDVWFTNTEASPLDEVVLRIYGNAVVTKAGAPVTFLSGSCSIGGTCVVSRESDSALSVKPASPVAAGARLKIHVDLTGKLDTIDSSRTSMFAQGLESLTSLGGGEAAGNYGLLATGDGISSLANFYPVVARRRDGKWERDDASTMGDLGSDEMANVHARIAVDKDVALFTSGVTVSDVASGGTHAVEIDAAMVRDFAVIASRDLDSETKTVGDVQVRSVFLKKERAPGMKVLDTATHALEDYEKRFGAYPYADLDVVEAPLVGGAGGVEFAGLVTIASMFYRDPMPSGGVGGLLGGLLGSGGGGGMGGLLSGDPFGALGGDPSGELDDDGSKPLDEQGDEDGDGDGDDEPTVSKPPSVHLFALPPLGALGSGSPADPSKKSAPKGTGGTGSSSATGAASPVSAMMDSMLEFVTAHEVAHQFWHGLVGSDSRLHPYLDEGLAQWTAMLYLEDRYGAARADKDGEMNVAMNYKVMRLMGNEDAAVDQPASAFKGMVSYAGLVYGKGPYMWPALRKELGDTQFFDGIRTYVAAYRLRLAPPRALIDALATTGGGAKAADVHAIEKRWLDGRHGDDDLGKADLMSMFGPMLGLDPTDPQTKLIMKLAEGLIGSLGGSGGGGGGGSSGGGPDLGELLKGLGDE